MLQASVPSILNLIHKMVNSILSSGFYPYAWTTQSLSPLHKKGLNTDPKNYKGIAIANNLSKIYLQILHTRLLKFCTLNNIVSDNQIVYKNDSRTADHILT